jgi:hypothetical protein
MGSLAVTLVLFLPLLMLFNFIINNYREHILAWIQKSRVGQMLKATKIFETYQTLRGWGGGR